MNWVMDRAFPEDIPLEAKMVSKAIERAQTTVESRNFEIRKDVLKYDEVMNEQRKIIYRRRQQIIDGEDLSEQAYEIIEEVVSSIAGSYCTSDYAETWEIEPLLKECASYFPVSLSQEAVLAMHSVAELVERIVGDALDQYKQKEGQIGSDVLRSIERKVMLDVIDQHWREHLYEMDYLREGINLRAMGQRDPLTEWQREGFEMFGVMMESIKSDFVRFVMKLNVVSEDERRKQQRLSYSAPDNPVQGSSAYNSFGMDPSLAAAQNGSINQGMPNQEVVQKPVHVEDVPGRNELCFCGSGKKYKHCHGR